LNPLSLAADGGMGEQMSKAKQRKKKEILSKCVHLNMIVEFGITLFTSLPSPL
jgi:hypothetical protein